MSLMPTYEYACRSCDRHHIAKQRITDAPLTDCPECGGRLRRVIHPAAVTFRGPGFYTTDSKEK